MVELPGFVRDDGAAALDALGGIEAVAAAAGGQAAYLRLALRGGDPMAHPLLGDRRPARGLLLRVSRAGGARARTPLPCAHRQHTLRLAPVMPRRVLHSRRLASTGPCTVMPF